MTDEELKKHKEEYKKPENIKNRQIKFIKKKKLPKYKADPEKPNCCLDCMDLTFNVDDSIECVITGETVFNPFEKVGEYCPKRNKPG